MLKKLIIFIFGIILISMSVFITSADVRTTSQPAEGTGVYVAGNPDMYPIEYYDSEKKEYTGIIPAMYEKISENSGYDFIYVSAGEKNEQKELAKNCQVEMVSVHEKGAIGDMADDIYITSFDDKGKTVEIYIGFTDIASDDLKDAISSGIKDFTPEEIISYSADYSNGSYSGESAAYMILVLSGVLVLFIIALVIALVIKRKKKKKDIGVSRVDTLTGIANGKYFGEWFSSFITPASSTLYYVAYISIDVNRIIRYSDAVECENIQTFAASEISSVSRETDLCARIHDGVFALAFEASNEDEAEKIMDGLMTKLNSFASEVMIKYNIRFHGGVFHLSGPNIPYEKAMFNAHQGYFYAVDHEMNYKFADEKLLDHTKYVGNLQKKLWKAIDDNEFVIYVQYIFDGRGEKVIGAEALSRWDSLEDGIIRPKDYIGLLEEAEMIDRFDFYILDECCKMLEHWKDTNKKNVKLACNMSRITLSSEDYFETFIQIISKYNFDYRRLVIEITEDTLSFNDNAVISNINKCKELGCTIVLDDFGSGFSSMRDIGEYPIDTIKIDRKLIINTKEEKGRELLNSLVIFAHSLGIKALCEGVESEDELKYAIESGCDFIQGFALSRTNPAEEESVERNLDFI